MTRPARTIYENSSPNSSRTEVRTVHGVLGKETDKAILITEQESGKDIWFPLSQVISIHRTRSIVNNTVDSIVVTKWIYDQKELQS